MGIPTGIPDLDQILLGMQPSELLIVAGRPSSGKSSLMVDMALSAAIEGESVYLASIEMSTKSVTERLIANCAGLGLRHLKQGELTDAEKTRANKAVDDLEKMDISIFNGTSFSGRIIQDIQSTDCTCAFVDYMQLLQNGDARSRSSELETIVNDFKQLAINKNIPIVMLSQLNRRVEDRENNLPRLSDLRDSGGIEQTADSVMFVHRPDYYKLDKDVTAQDGGEAYIFVAKNRNGPLGKVPVVWLAEQCSFKALPPHMQMNLY